MYDWAGGNQDRSQREFLIQASQFDDPAFLRRARAVSAAWTQLAAECEAQRSALLAMTQLRLAVAAELAGHDWSRVGPHLQEPHAAEYLAALHRQWRPRLRGPVEPARSSRQIRRALAELLDSMRRFNDRWHVHLQSVDREPVNRMRRDYNRYYVIEKACALRSEAMAVAGFQPLELVTIEKLAEHFPLLDVPRLCG